MYSNRVKLFFDAISRSERWRYTLILVAFVSWVLLTLWGMWEQQHTMEGGEPYAIWIKGIFLNFFLLTTYMYFRYADAQKSDNEDFYGLLWKVFAMGLACGFFSATLAFFVRLVNDYFSHHTLFYNFFYHLDFGLLVVFLMTAFFKWKHKILYHSSRFTAVIWYIFEFSLLSTLLFHFFRFKLFDTVFNAFFVLFALMGIYLSFNAKWIANLNAKQKLYSLFFCLLLLAVQGYFFKEILDYKDMNVNYLTFLILDLTKSIFFASLYCFSAIYTVTILLVLLFSLPTSSVFEKKISELVSFQQLSASILSGENEQKVYLVLLESAIQTLRADAAWLEIENKNDDLISKKINKQEALEILKAINAYKADASIPRKYTPEKLFGNPNAIQYQSILTLPLIADNNFLGRLVLLKKLPDAFDNIIINTLNSFVTQASLAIYNFRLLSSTVETQRYKEELKIAQRVQKSLLPETILVKDNLEIFVKNGSADEIGGDYYDYYQVGEHKYALIIGDVAGKGTSAAFNMAQLKGVFHSLVRLDLSPDLFFEYANNALSGCLERNSFITATYLVVDAEQRKIYSSRAGHCPTLYYSHESKEVRYLQEKGLGLGIIRNEDYRKYIQIRTFEYKKGDILMLYSDGIYEARNKHTREEYGYDRLHEFFKMHCNLPLADIAHKLLEDIYAFTQCDRLDDDYTVLLLKFP
ncbi:MAG: serine/threonine-protein phosphatase [Bernardetiaceae bacterium]|nr:serine/threonine-protein phosphatase [Bernardetiaceae bacterium]